MIKSKTIVITKLGSKRGFTPVVADVSQVYSCFLVAEREVAEVECVPAP